MDLTGGQFALLFVLMLALITGIVLGIIGISGHRRRKKHEQLSCFADGIYEKETSVGSGPYFPAFYVAYQVDGKKYHLTERIQYRDDPEGKLNRYGQPLMIPVIGDVRPGDTVTVQYDPRKPKRACVYGNVKVSKGK